MKPHPSTAQRVLCWFGKAVDLNFEFFLPPRGLLPRIGVRYRNTTTYHLSHLSVSIGVRRAYRYIITNAFVFALRYIKQDLYTT